MPNMSSTFLIIPRQRRNISTNSSCVPSRRARRPKRASSPGAPLCQSCVSNPEDWSRREKAPSSALPQFLQLRREITIPLPQTGQFPSTAFVRTIVPYPLSIVCAHAQLGHKTAKPTRALSLQGYKASTHILLSRNITREINKINILMNKINIYIDFIKTSLWTTCNKEDGNPKFTLRNTMLAC